MKRKNLPFGRQFLNSFGIGITVDNLTIHSCPSPICIPPFCFLDILICHVYGTGIVVNEVTLLLFSIYRPITDYDNVRCRADTSILST